MNVKVNKVFVNSVNEEIFVISIMSKDNDIQNINLTKGEYNDLVASLRSINIEEL
jgi:hypothetical protein